MEKIIHKTIKDINKAKILSPLNLETPDKVFEENFPYSFLTTC